MGYAEVCVNSPAARRRTFSYAIPPGLSVEVGQAVWVPFGSQLLQGVVLELSTHPQVEETREIAGVIDSCPLLSPAQVTLARWISDYYLSPLFDAIALALPPGFERKSLTFISATPSAKEPGGLALDERQKEVLGLLRCRDRVSLKELETTLGKKKAQSIISGLVKRGLVVRSYELEPVKVKPKRELCLALAKPAEVRQEIDRLRRKRAYRQAALLDFLAQHAGTAPLTEASREANGNRAVVKALESKGLIILRPVEVRRDPLSRLDVKPSLPLTLTPAQKLALEEIKSRLSGKDEASPSVFLLHGVTGSGKTEVYLQALAEAVKLGKRGIVLVPEIALTPQTIERFASRFPGKVAVLHSGLSLGEQFDEWRRIHDGDFDVVIGPRSAVFVPQPHLGLIVIDEEHEWTYKQAENSPRYHARSAAIKLAELIGAVVILGSATPDVESFYHARRGDYRLLQLPERVTPGESLPGVEVVDLRKELKAGNRSLFSRSLAKGIGDALDGGEQVILFLNRRGAATHIQCRNCGFVILCKRCEVALTYHLTEDALVCHQCNLRAAVPQICPRCRSRRIRFLGVGTQKLEQEAGFAFPRARLLRWDSDTTRRKGAHGQILNRFQAGQADILVGTQMVAKGLDLPMVTLVGVVSADVSLNLPDFRAGERTFQLLSQVAGRAGRGIRGGRVVIQTYSPEHYAIRAAAAHDYISFYEQEISYRRELRDPPFTQLARLVYQHTNDLRCLEETQRVKRLLVAERDARGLDIALLGPAPAFVHRLRGRFRWQIILRGSGLTAFLSPLYLPVGWTVDVDPAGLA